MAVWQGCEHLIAQRQIVQSGMQYLVEQRVGVLQSTCRPKPRETIVTESDSCALCTSAIRSDSEMNGVALGAIAALSVCLSARGSERYGPTMARGTHAQVVVTHDRHRVAKQPDCELCCARQTSRTR